MDRFQTAIDAFDQANAEDPVREEFEGASWPRELLYAQRMSRWLERLEPEAPEELRLAARSQHIRRWMIPRDTYPRDRVGYLRWRTDLYKFHAGQAAQILQQAGYDAGTVARVQSLLRKENIKQDKQMQTLEDVICLVFLENYFAGFAKDKDPAKLRGILSRTWKKMSGRGREAALGLKLPPEARRLIEEALSDPDPGGT